MSTTRVRSVRHGIQRIIILNPNVTLYRTFKKCFTTDDGSAEKDVNFVENTCAQRSGTSYLRNLSRFLRKTQRISNIYAVVCPVDFSGPMDNEHNT